MRDNPDADRFSDDNDDLYGDDPDSEWADPDLDEMLEEGEAGALDADPDGGLPHAKAASQRAILGVPDDLGEDDESPVHAWQDAIIDEVNEILEDDHRWNEAAERAYQALAIDPAYPRAANAVLRCYLTKQTLKDMHRVLSRRFDPGDEMPNRQHRMLADSYRVLSHADVWLNWSEEIPLELADVAGLIQKGCAALNDAYWAGETGAYRRARASFKAALNRCRNRAALMWFLARLYADKGYFADSAALLGALLAAGSSDRDVERLYAEMTWWRDQGRWLPWIH